MFCFKMDQNGLTLKVNIQWIFSFDFAKKRKETVTNNMIMKSQAIGLKK